MSSTVICCPQDQRLIEGLCRGDEWALAEVHALHASRVFELVRRIVIDRRAAEDVTQGVLALVE